MRRIVVHREHDDSRLRICPQNALDRRGGTAAGHPEIERDNVDSSRNRCQRGQYVAMIAALGNHFHVSL